MQFKAFKYTIALAVIILFLSAIPGNRLPSFSFKAGDKIGHFLAYAALAAAFSTEYARHIRWSNKTGRWLIWIVAVCVAYGLIIEGLQGSVLYQRTFDYADMAANTIGTGIGVATYYILYSFLKRHERFY